MTRLRIPVIVGVGGGVGTTTVAAVLHGRDGGRCAARPEPDVDVLVCRCVGESLCRAVELASAVAATGPRPVLAVCADEAGPTVGHLPIGLRIIRLQFSGVVVLPHVGRWRRVPEPHVEAAALLARPPAALPRELRAYAAAMRVLARAVAGSGRLERTPAPAATPVRAAVLWRGLHPVQRPERIRSLTAPTGSRPQPEPDDDDIEAGMVGMTEAVG